MSNGNLVPEAVKAQEGCWSRASMVLRTRHSTRRDFRARGRVRLLRNTRIDEYWGFDISSARVEPVAASVTSGMSCIYD